jgi:hypothetical protein
MAQKTIVLENFSGGEYASLGDWKPPANSFTATNMLVSRRGELMVRPGLFKQNPSGLANGVVHGFGMTPLSDNDAWFVQGTAVRTFSLTAGNNLKTSATALAETPTGPLDYIIDGGVVYFTSRTDKVYSLTPQTGATLPTVAALTGSPGGLTIAKYGERWVVGAIDGSFAYRIRYSAAADPNSWPSANFIDIGDNYGIAKLLPQRQHLTIAKARSFWILTGTLGSSPTVRKIADINGPSDPLQATIIFPDIIHFGGLGTTYPSTFDGTRVDQAQYLEKLPTFDQFNAFPPVAGVGVTRGKDNCVTWVTSSETALTNLNGIWTYHTFGVPLSGYTVPYMPTDNIIAFCDGGSAGATPNFYIWNLTGDSPGIEGGGNFQRAGDDSSTALSGNVTFPEWWASDGDEFYVRSVAVDFRTWNNGAANNNHFDLTVDMLRRYSSTSPVSSNTVSFDEAPSASSASGTLQRRVFGFGEQGRGNGVQLRFADCRGMAIHRVTMVVESLPGRF